jgi:cathepsin L
MEQIAMCSPNPQSCGGTGGCEGATAEIAYEYAAGSNCPGMLEEFQYPYTSYHGEDFACVNTMSSPIRIGGYIQLPSNQLPLQML